MPLGSSLPCSLGPRSVVRENLYLDSRSNLRCLDGTLRDPKRTLMLPLISLLRTAYLSRANLTLENLAFRQQLTVYQQNQKHPRLQRGDRAFFTMGGP